MLRQWVFCCAVATAALFHAIAAASPPGSIQPTATDADSVYTLYHPRLVFSRDELPALAAKLRDGGPDDDAYAFIRNLVVNEYPSETLGDLLGVTFGMNFLLNAGLVAQIDEPANEAAKELGRRLTLSLADSLAADDNVFYAPVRLRALCFGYDMCMERATPAERARVRAEIESYVDSLMLAFNYERWLHPPYTSNITAMIGSSLGLAAICLADEMEPPRVAAALERADTFVTTWMRYHLDRDGACFEGVQYGSWALRHLPWYFHARRRYDGLDYAALPAIRNVEHWLAYEILPAPGALVNNLNDTAYLNHSLSRHNTYLDWALSAWSSGLSAWLWERILGADGYDYGALADRAATVVWYRPIAQRDPDGVLPPNFLWKDRGLYYYRTGWPLLGGSDDLVFSFYSGEFHGGHSQEDQNGFTLYAFGERLAVDNGFEAPNAESEAHNMIFIDGKGQHHSGGSVGTDGRIVSHVLSGYADYLFGDATGAYTTHSPYNDPGVPFPDDDWSYGYDGANPVQWAYREWLVVHGNDTPPYFVLLDDIQKDGAVHAYDWRMHAEQSYAIDTTANPLRIAGSRARLDIDVCYPTFDEVIRAVAPRTNPSVDPSTNVLTLSTQAVRGVFALVLRPAGPLTPAPVVRTASFSWGGAEVLEWPNGATDVVLAHAGDDTVTVAPSAFAPGPPGALPLSTDARLLQVRSRPGAPLRAAVVAATTCDLRAIPFLRVENGALSLVLAGRTVHVDREDAEFRLYAPEADSLLVGKKPLRFRRDGDFIVREASAAGRTPSLAPTIRVYPQPAARAMTISVESDQAGAMEAEIFDVRGRKVRSLWRGDRASGRTVLSWDGSGDGSRPLASGVYFVRVRGVGATATARIVLVR